MSTPFARIARRVSQARRSATGDLVEMEAPEIFLWGLPPGLRGYAYQAEP